MPGRAHFEQARERSSARSRYVSDRMARRTLAGGAKKRPTRYEPDRGDPELSRALAAHRRGRLAEALERYEAVVARTPDGLDGWMNLGAVAALRGRWQRAVEAFVVAAALAPTDARVARDAGIALASLGRFDEATASLERAVALEPESVGAWLHLARTLEGSGNLARSVEVAREATRRAPEQAASWLELARAVFDDRDLGPTIDAAERAAHCADGALGQVWLASALLLSGDASRSERAFDGLAGAWADPVSGFRALAAERTSTTRWSAAKRGALLFATDEVPREGAVIELGVRHGTSLRLLAARLECEVIGFDGFDGLPEGWQGKPEGLFATDGFLPDVPDSARLVVGRFERTLPAFAASMSQRIRFLHIDSDLYSSAACGLEHLGPELVDGAIVAFDELVGNAGWQGEEHRAFAEATARLGWHTELVAAGFLTGQAAYRIRRIG